MSLFLKYCQSIRIILLQNRLLGISLFAAHKTHFEKCKTGFLLNISALLLFPAYCIYTSHLKLTEDLPILSRIIQTAMIIANGVYVASVWICAITRCNRMQKVFQKMINFDRELRKMGVSINYGKQKRRDLAQMLIRFFLVVAISLYVLIVRVYIEDSDIHSEIVRMIAHVYKSATCHQILHLVSMVRLRCSILNQILEKMIIRHQVEADDINALCKMHHQLTDFIQHFNATFGTQLLVFFGMSFVHAAVAVFHLVQPTVFKLIHLGILCYGLFLTADVVCICVCCCRAVDEVNDTARLFLSMSSANGSVAHKIKRFLLHRATAKTEFTAASFFAIDRSLMVSMVAGVATYAFILIQSSGENIYWHDTHEWMG